MDGELPHDSEKLKEYIDKLHDRIEFLEEELQASQRDLLETREDRNEQKKMNDRWRKHSLDNLGELEEFKNDLKSAVDNSKVSSE